MMMKVTPLSEVVTIKERPLLILLMLTDSRKLIQTKKHGLNTSKVRTSQSANHFIGYLKAIKAKLEEAGKTERVAVFQKGATALVKHILEKFDEIQIFVGENYDMDAGFGYCYQKEQEDAGPTFFFFHDGLRLEKF